MGNLSNFQTILWPETKVSNVGFYKKPSAGFPAGSVIEAPFTRAGAGRKVINAAGNLVDAAANLPAWTFPIGGSSSGCPYLSFLPSVENLQRYSEDLTNNGAYSKSGNGAAQTSLISSPIDGVNYDEVYNNGGGTSRVRFDTSSITSTDQTISFFCKKKDETNLLISDSVTGTTLLNVNFNFDTGAFDAQSGTAYTDSGVVDFGSGNYFIWIELDTSVSTAPAFFLDDYTSGNGSYVTGVLVKEGSYISPLDYIPTTTAAVTRSVDDLTNITDFQGEGYLLTEEGSLIFQVGSNGQTSGFEAKFRLGNATTSLKFAVYNVGGEEGFRIRSYSPTSYTSDLIPNGQLVRFVFVFTSSELKIYLNGFLLTTLSGDYSLDRLTTANAANGLNFKMLNFAPTALTASEAEAASAWPSASLLISDLGYTLA